MYVVQIRSLPLTKPVITKVEHVMWFLPRLVGNCRKRGSQTEYVGERSPSLAFHGNFYRLGYGLHLPGLCWLSALEITHHGLLYWSPLWERSKTLFFPSPFPQAIVLTILSLELSHHTQPCGFLLATEYQSRTVCHSFFFNDLGCGLGLSAATCPGKILVLVWKLGSIPGRCNLKPALVLGQGEKDERGSRACWQAAGVFSLSQENLQMRLALGGRKLGSSPQLSAIL